MAKSGPGNCTICASKHRASIDLGLVRGMSHRALAIRFECSPDAIGRHALNHLSPVQRAALLTASQPAAVDLDQLHANESAGLLAQLVAQRGRLQVLAEAAADIGDARGAVSAESAILSNLALVGKLLGIIMQHHNVQHTSLLVSPDYLKLRTTLIESLRPFPEAARAVGAALHRLESDAATDITAASERRAPILIEATATATTPIPPPPC